MTTADHSSFAPSARRSANAKLSTKSIPSHNGQAFLLFTCLFCGTILAFDVTAEAIAAFQVPFSAYNTMHIAIEAIATVFLGVGAVFAYSHMKTLRIRAEHDEEQLLRLRREFDGVLQERFSAWALSKSEIDVALLTIRGLSIHRIAELRHTQQGTIKAQLSAIFRKAGVSSRTELLAMFMDELLDFGATAQDNLQQ
jgi:DNA-binding NarL/FixJ family response regulator